KYLAGIAAFGVLAAAALAQQVKRADYDVTNYVIDAKASPDENKLSANADVTFTLLEDTRSITFELNGSLKVDSVERLDNAALQPVQTQRPANAR
ncbi:hypothetical protein OFB80_28790, partial [Escherichia coli]|nr:hypothetical protein [Escherichia coli]